MKMRSDLSKLWEEARRYGKVRLSTMDDGLYYCVIEFDSIAYTTLKAASDFNQPTPESAVSAAIVVAKTVVKDMVRINKEMIGDV